MVNLVLLVGAARGWSMWRGASVGPRLKKVVAVLSWLEAAQLWNRLHEALAEPPPLFEFLPFPLPLLEGTPVLSLPSSDPGLERRRYQRRHRYPPTREYLLKSSTHLTRPLTPRWHDRSEQYRWAQYVYFGDQMR